MDELTKRRLVGGAVLLIALVAVTGVFFRGSGELIPAATPVGEQLYAVHNPGDVEAIEDGVPDETGPLAATGSPDDLVSAASSAEVSRAVTAPTVTPAPPPDVASTAKPAPKAQPKPVEAKPPEAKPVEAKPVPKPVESKPVAVKAGEWVVQVGSFASRNNAVSVQKRLEGMGYAVLVSPTAKTPPLYRVRVGPYGTVEQAREAAGRLRTALKQDVKVVPAAG